MPKKRICSIDDCDKTAVSKGYCTKHYQRYRKHGCPNGHAFNRNGACLEFLESIKNTADENCILWPFSTTSRGYGSIRHKVSRGAHAVSLYLRTGKKPEGMYCLHSCHNPSCVNPNHLRWGTPKENNQDMIRAGRSLTGEKNTNSILNEQSVLEIFFDNRSQGEIARSYGVTQSCVSLIKRRKSWRHVTAAL